MRLSHVAAVSRSILLVIAASVPLAFGSDDVPRWITVSTTPGSRVVVVPVYESDPSLPAKRILRVPRWILVGILSRESRSYFNCDDQIVYVDKRRSSIGARGPTQILKNAFQDHQYRSERYTWLESDPDFALDMTERILLAHKAALGTWEAAIRAYRSGRGKWASEVAGRYYADVRALGNEKRVRK